MKFVAGKAKETIMQNVQSITLDVNNCIEYKYINAKQGDNYSRFLKITLTEDGEKITPSGRCTASFRCLKPDGRICVNKAVINTDGTITVSLTEQVLASAGTVRADISLLDGSMVLSSATFFITVEASPAMEGSILSSDEFLILTETAKEARAAINSISDVTDDIQTALSGVEDVKAYIGYTEGDILGLCADYENKRFTRLAGAVGLNAGEDFDKFPMYGGMKRCNVSDNGTITAYYGDDNYADDGSNGQVMVYVPRFYYKVVPLKLEKIANGFGYHIRKANYYVTDKPLAGFKLHPAFYDEQGNETEYFLYSAYEGSLQKAAGSGYVNDSTASEVSVDFSKALICSTTVHKPISSQNITLTRANAQQLASNHGRGWHIETIKAVSAIQLLMMMEFGTMNMQSAIGRGVVDLNDLPGSCNGASYTGSTMVLGNKTGAATATANSTNGTTVTYREDGCVNISYRGIENPWGNIWRFVNGINVWGDGTMTGGQAYIADDFAFSETKHTENYQSAGFVLPNESGYINAMGYGSEKYDWLFIPSEAGGSSALPVGDYTYINEDLNGYKAVRFGGSWAGKTNAGEFCWHMRSAVSYNSYDIGCRLIYVPSAE